MTDLDLDIRNYSIPDLERFFQVNDVKYDAAMLEQKKRNWSDKIAGLDAPFKTQFRAFLEESVKILLQQKAYVDAQPNKDIYGVPAKIVKQEDMDKYQKPVISKPDIPFVYSKNSEYYGGILNPLERHLSSRVLSISSLFRDAVPKKECNERIPWTNANDFVFKLPEPFKNVAAIELMSIELPTIYDVYEGTNLFYINTIPVTIPYGNYEAAAMIVAVQDALLDAGFPDISFNIDANSGISSFTSPVAFIYASLTTSNNAVYETLGWKLGFQQYTYPSLQEIYSEAPYTPSSNQYIFLEVDDYNRNNQSNAIMAQTSNAFFISNNVLARISLQELFFQGVTRIYKKREYFGSVRIEKLRIRLLNQFGKPLSMNGSNYSFALELKQIYA